MVVTISTAGVKTEHQTPPDSPLGKILNPKTAPDARQPARGCMYGLLYCTALDKIIC